MFEKMARFYKGVKSFEFPGDFEECVRSFQQLWLLGQICPFEFEEY
jgi:hypothetical protein